MSGHPHDRRQRIRHRPSEGRQVDPATVQPVTSDARETLIGPHLAAGPRVHRTQVQSLGPPCPPPARAVPTPSAPGVWEPGSHPARGVRWKRVFLRMRDETMILPYFLEPCTILTCGRHGRALGLTDFGGPRAATACHPLAKGRTPREGAQPDACCSSEGTPAGRPSALWNDPVHPHATPCMTLACLVPDRSRVELPDASPGRDPSPIPSTVCVPCGRHPQSPSHLEPAESTQASRRPVSPEAISNPSCGSLVQSGCWFRRRTHGFARTDGAARPTPEARALPKTRLGQRALGALL